MKLEDCKKGLKVRVLGKTIHGERNYNNNLFPAHERGWGYIRNTTLVCNEGTVYLQEIPEGQREDGGYSPNDLEPYIEPEETEYRQLKDITPRAIFRDKYSANTFSFMQQFIHFVSIFNLEYEEVLPFNDLLFELEVDPSLADLLIQHGFIEKVVEEVTYHIGNNLVNAEDEKAVIVQTGPKDVCIMHNYNRWIDPIIVKDVTLITAEEFKLMNGYNGTWRKDK